jgi:predicted transcriptional regulator
MKEAPVEGRLAIPRALERAVLMEAGHRCAIPTCQQVPVQIAHIVPWAQVKEHAFENLIALCPTCHARYDRKQIDRMAMFQYKANLVLLNGRYSDLERRVLKMFVEKSNLESVWIEKSLDILMMYLVQDGLVLKDQDIKYHFATGTPYCLTDKGRDFIGRWVNAEELE